MAVPSALTFEEIKDSILRFNKLKDDTEADTVATSAIRTGLVRLASEGLKGLLATSELTLTSGQNTVTLPSDFSIAFSMHLLDVSDKRDGRVPYLGEEDFDFAFSDSEGVAGDPTSYTVRGGLPTQAEFDRAPNANSLTIHPKVRLRYFQRVDNLATSTSTFSIAPEFEEYLVWFGRSQVSAIYDAKKYPLAAQEASRAWFDLRRRNAIRDLQDWY